MMQQSSFWSHLEFRIFLEGLKRQEAMADEWTVVHGRNARRTNKGKSIALGGCRVSSTAQDATSSVSAGYSGRHDAHLSTSNLSLPGWGRREETVQSTSRTKEESRLTNSSCGFDESSHATGRGCQPRQTGSVPYAMVPEEAEVDKHEVEKIVARVKNAM